MHIVSSGWFGWSVLWLCPILWRLFRALILKNSVLHGQGSIRLWLGSVLGLAASSGLESMVRSDGVAFGHAVAGVATGLLGSVLGAVLLLILLGLAGRWIFLSRASGHMEAAERKNVAPSIESVVRPMAGMADTAGSMVSARTATARTRVPGDTPRRIPSWSLPPPPANDKANRYTKFTPPRQTRPAQARATNEWATVESLRPTSAMRARAASLQTMAAKTTLPLPGTRRPAEAGASRINHAPAGSPLPQASQAVVIPLPEVPVPTRQTDQEPLSIAAVATVTTTASTSTSTSATGLTSSLTAQPRPEPVSPPLSLAEQEIADGPGRGEAVHDTTGLQAANAMPARPATPLHEAVMPAAVPQRPTLPEVSDRFEFQPSHELDVELPGLDLLDVPRGGAVSIAPARLAETGQLIEQRLKEFKVPVSVLGAFAGPVITRYEVEPATGVRGAQIVGLMRDLARALGLTSIRVVETIPGKTCMGLELPNPQRQTIQLSEILNAPAYRQSSSFLTLALGKDITGVPVTTDLARAPHMLVAGTTGSGKSVAINAMILSLLYKSTPADVRLIMIDPKMLELSVYDGIPHLLAPVVTDMKHAANALNWCVGEMDKRYRLMSALGVRNLAGYNQKIRDAAAQEKKIANPFSLTPDAPEPLSTLPLIVVVIDELADLMMVAGKKIEELIARLAQKARAAGIHLILATQRPSVDVITGLIKANIPTRVAFQVSSKIDSRTVLDQMGAEALLGHGDMLFLPPGSGYPQRVHGAFVSDQEVHRVVEFLKQFGEPEYDETILAGVPVEDSAADGMAPDANAEADPLYDEAVAFVVRTRRASISSVQRQFRIGYNRAARLVEQMEAAGILSPMATNGSRDVLAPPLD